MWYEMIEDGVFLNTGEVVGIYYGICEAILHNAVQEIDQRGTIYSKSSQICVHADDVVIVTRSET
jgi:hypothetical protein